MRWMNRFIFFGAVRRMAGTNLMLKKGQVVFKEGDASDGMYLVRKGELLVFLEREGNEVQLAKVGSGGMIGEMAFFENKARSASIRAVEPCEVSRISNSDFKNLMKQIPKWFVGIMTSLSSRLRDTNERLQKLEAESKGHKGRYETVLRILHVLGLLWHKYGTKEGREFLLPRSEADKGLAVIFKLGNKEIDGLFKVLIRHRLIGRKVDGYGNKVLSMTNKAVLPQLVDFIEQFIEFYDDITSFPEPALELLECLGELIKESSYEQANIGFEDLVVEGERSLLEVDKWSAQLDLFKKQNGVIQLVKMGNGKVGLRVNVKSFKPWFERIKMLSGLTQEGLAR